MHRCRIDFEVGGAESQELRAKQYAYYNCFRNKSTIIHTSSVSLLISTVTA